MELVDLIFDHEQFNQNIGQLPPYDYDTALQHYKADYVAKCVAPNNRFNPYENDNVTCQLKPWLQAATKVNYVNILLKYIYLKNDANKEASKEDSKFKRNLLNNNLAHIVKRSPIEVDNLFSDPSVTNTAYDNSLIWALDSVPSYKLTSKSIDRLETIVKNNGTNQDAIKLSLGLLTTNIMLHPVDKPRVQFLVDQAKLTGQTQNNKEAIFAKFMRNVAIAKECPTSWFDDFLQLMPNDTDKHFLAKGFFEAHKLHGCSPKVDGLSHFASLLDDGTIRDQDVDFMSNVLIKSLEVEKDLTKIKQIEDYVQLILDKAGKLPTKLTLAVIKFFDGNQNFFSKILFELVAEDKMLTVSVLEKIQPLVTKFKDPQMALFIATRLVQYHFTLPVETLEFFAKQIVQSYGNQKTAVLVLFDKLQSIPQEMQSQIVDALLLVMPKASHYQKELAESILSKVQLSDVQKVSIGVQRQAFEFNQDISFEQKRTIYTALLKRLSEETYVELSAFYRDLLLSQNYEMVSFAREALNSIAAVGTFELTSIEQQILELLQRFENNKETIFVNINSTESIEQKAGATVLVGDIPIYIANSDGNALPINHIKVENAYSYESTSSVPSTSEQSKLCSAAPDALNYLSFGRQYFFLTPTQCATFAESLKSIDWSLGHYLKLIKFNDFREVSEFIDFVVNNGIAETWLYNSIKDQREIKDVYSLLLDLLVDGMLKETGASSATSRVVEVNIRLANQELHWKASSLIELVQQFDDAKELAAVVEKIVEYEVDPGLIDRYGYNANDYFNKESQDTLLLRINQIIQDNKFYSEKDVATLFLELAEENPRNQGLLDLIGDSEQNSYFAKQLRSITEIQLDWLEYEKTATYTGEQIGKQLSSWQQEDFAKWKQGVKGVTDDNIAEVLAVMGQAAHETIFNKTSFPRAVQLLATLFSFKSENGGLMQISTGEGKSLIIAMLAVIQVMNGRRGDILTSSEVLAKRDAMDNYQFYTLLGTSVGYNIGWGYISKPLDTVEKIAKLFELTPREIMDLNPTLPSDGFIELGLEIKLPFDENRGKECYLRDIVYGDTLHFIGDALRDIGRDMRHGRAFEFLIIDEVDSSLIDSTKMKVQLSDSIPGFEYLNQILVQVRGTAISIARFMQQEGEKCRFELPENQNVPVEIAKIAESYKSVNSVGNTPPSKLLDKDCGTELKEFIVEYSKEVLYNYMQGEKREILIPNFLMRFAHDQINNWAESLLQSFFQKEKHSYIVVDPIEGSRYPFKVIAPIDYENTGVIQTNLQWSNGLHQFLEIKHSLTLVPENVISIFMSYAAFFAKYKGSIFGVTGTLGNEHHHKFLKEVYDVNTAIIPTFIEKDLQIIPTMIFEENEQATEEIIEGAKRKANNSRAVLIILQSIQEVEELREKIIDSGYDESKVFLYGTTNKELEYNVRSKREMQPGDIIVATNMAGRGTDLKLSPVVKKNGGLHVIMGELANSVRVQDQGFGRAARQGETGSAQIITSMDKLDTECSVYDELCLFEERDDRELNRLDHDKQTTLVIFSTKDELFSRFVELQKEVNSPTGYKVILDNPEQLEPKSLYVYLQDGRVYLKIVPKIPENGQMEANLLVTKDITDVLNILDPKLVRHITTIIAAKANKSANLNHQAFEAINFIAASRGYSDLPVILNRVNYDFGQLTDWSSNSWIESYMRSAPKYQDLLQEEDLQASYENAKLRKKFSLWLKDREVYNNGNELREINSRFGMFLKKYERDDLELDKSSPKELVVYKDSLFKAFEEFKGEIIGFKEKGKLIQNQFMLVLKSWQYVNIYFKQLKGEYKDQTAAIVVPKNEEPQGWFSSLKKVGSAIKDSVAALFKTVKARLTFDGENLAPTRPLESAKEFLEKSISLDPLTAWAGHNALGYIKLLLDGQGIISTKQAQAAAQVKSEFASSIHAAITGITMHEIPSLEIMLSSLESYGNFKMTSDLAIQIITEIETLKKFKDVMQKNLNTASQASGKEMIYVYKFYNMTEVVGSVNTTDVIFNKFNETSNFHLTARTALVEHMQGVESTSKKMLVDKYSEKGIYLFEVLTYGLEEPKKSWLGTVIAIAIGVALVATGLWMLSIPAMGSMGAIFGSALVSQGVGDIISSMISIGTGNPIDFHDYIRSKGISIGVTIATLGVLGFMEYAGVLPDGWLAGRATDLQQMSANPGEFLTGVTAIQATATLASAVLYNGAKQLIDTDDIAAEASAVIDDIIASFNELLNRIYATDELNGNDELKLTLWAAIVRVVTLYQNRFQDDQTQFVTGVASGLGGYALLGLGSFGGILGMASVADTAVRVSMGQMKNNEAMSRIASGTRDAISTMGGWAYNSAQMLEKQLIKTHGLEVGEGIYSELSSQKFVVGGEIEYRSCDKFAGAKLSGGLSGYGGAGLVKECEKVGGYITQPSRHLAGLKSDFVGLVSNSVGNIQKKEVLGPVVNMVGGEVGNHVGPLLVSVVTEGIKHADEDQPQFEQEFDAEEVAARSGLDQNPAEEEKQARKAAVKKKVGAVAAGSCPGDGEAVCRAVGSSKQKAAAELEKLKDADLAVEINKLPDPLKRKVVNIVQSFDELQDKLLKGSLNGNIKPYAEKFNSLMKTIAEIESKYPLETKATVLGLRLVAHGIVGLLGGVSGVWAQTNKVLVDEARGAAIDYVAGDWLSAVANAGIQAMGSALIYADQELSAEEAGSTAVVLTGTTLSAHQFMTLVKYYKHLDFSKLRVVNGKIEGNVELKAEFKGMTQQDSSGKSGWQHGQKPILDEPNNNVPGNMVGHEAYKVELRASMDRPYVKDKSLNQIMDKIYRPNAEVGSGSTAAALREETVTGLAVKEKFHNQKAAQSTVFLKRWIKNNPTASSGDIAAAENVLKDLQNALKGVKNGK